MTVRIGFKTSPQDVDWATLDATWARAGEIAAGDHGGFDSGWLNDHLTNLDAAKRNSILVAYVDGCSHAEISQRLDSPLGTVKAWIKRGLQALKECMT